MTHKAWKKDVLSKLAAIGGVGKETVDYIHQHGVRISFSKYSESTGASWHLFKKISLNTRYYSYNTNLNDPKFLSLFVHEVHHLKQGVVTALSVYGELDAWQVEYRFYKEIHPAKLHPALEEMLTLPLNWDRDNLHHAAKLMQDYAGKGYHINWLPIYPIQKEIVHWLTRKELG